jgi:hypothetical protein
MSRLQWGQRAPADPNPSKEAIPLTGLIARFLSFDSFFDMALFVLIT